MINFAILAASAFILIYLDTSAYTEAILISAVTLAALSNRHNINVLHLSILLLLIISTETVIQVSQILIPNTELANVWQNTIIYSTYLGFDLIALFVIIFRPALSRTISPSHTKNVHMMRAEVLLISVYALFIIINLLALGENFIRNLEYLGIEENSAKMFWSWDWVYYSYPTLKRIVIALQLFAILMLVKEARQLKRLSPT